MSVAPRHRSKQCAHESLYYSGDGHLRTWWECADCGHTMWINTNRSRVGSEDGPRGKHQGTPDWLKDLIEWQE